MLQLQHISKAYAQTPVLQNVNFEVTQGEIVCLLGPSGCGKSTLLRIIAGLESQDRGQVLLNGEPIDAVPTHLRGFGFMFQDFALFPHRTVAQNVAFGLRMQHLPAREIDDRVASQLRLVGLDAAKYGSRAIDQLSGGERQRVALARSLAPQPRLLMLDEPLGSLDRALREQLTDELHQLIKRLGLAALYVTHDQAEAFALADRIVLMNSGQVAQIGTPAQLYRQPASLFVAQFLGLNNVIAGRVLGHAHGFVQVETVLGVIEITAAYTALPALGTAVQLVIRPEAACPCEAAHSQNVIVADVTRRSFRGATQRIQVRHASGQTLTLDWAAAALPNPLRFCLRPEAMSVV